MNFSRVIAMFLMLCLAAANAGCGGGAAQRMAAEAASARAAMTKNREAALAVSRALAEGKLAERSDALLAPELVYHGPGGMELDRDSYVAFMGTMNSAFTNMHLEFQQVLVEGDLVAARFTNTFVHTGLYQGIPSTNKQISISGTWIRRLRDGKVVAEWDSTDMLGLMQQLGVAHVGRRTVVSPKH